MAIVLAVAGHLTWLANYSNFYSVLTVVVCFILMVVFILRLNGENIFMHPRVLHYVNNITSEKAVISVRNPFCVKIKPESDNSLIDGVDLEFSLLQSSEVYILWGVNVPEFHQSLVYPWRDIINSLKELNWLHSHTLYIKHYGRLAKSLNTTLHISAPDGVTEEKFGHLPRSTYPLVIVNVVTEEDLDTQNVVIVFTVIHLKDNICKLDTQIVSQYIKTKNNQVCSLQPLFVTTSNVTSDRDRMTRSETEVVHDDNEAIIQHSTTETGSRRSSSDRSEICDDFDDCIVCQSMPISYALLPCRHACVCHVCLKKIGDKCPMCRGMIEIYFRVDGIENRRNSSDSRSGSRSDLTEHISETRWEMINRRLNEFFGFL